MYGAELLLHWSGVHQGAGGQVGVGHARAHRRLVSAGAASAHSAAVEFAACTTDIH